MQVSSIPEKVESVGQRRSTQKKKQKRSAVPPATPILLVSTPQANHEVSTEQQQKKQRTRPMSLHATTPSTTDRNERQGNARGTEFLKKSEKTDAKSAIIVGSSADTAAGPWPLFVRPHFACGGANRRSQRPSITSTTTPHPKPTPTTVFCICPSKFGFNCLHLRLQLFRWQWR